MNTSIRCMFVGMALLFSGSVAALDYLALWNLIEEHPDWTGVGSVEISVLDTYADTTQTTFPDNISSVETWRSIINNASEYEELTDVRRDLIRTTVKGGGVTEIDVRSDIDGAGTDSPERKLLLQTFGGGSDTINDLVAKFQNTDALWQIYGVGQNPDPEDFQESIDRYGS